MAGKKPVYNKELGRTSVEEPTLKKQAPSFKSEAPPEPTTEVVKDTRSAAKEALNKYIASEGDDALSSLIGGKE